MTDPALTEAQWGALEEIAENAWPVAVSLPLGELWDLEEKRLIKMELHGRTNYCLATDVGHEALAERWAATRPDSPKGGSR